VKIAVCFSGQIRTGVINYTNIHRFLGDLYSCCDFFVYTWDVETYSAVEHASKRLLEANIPAGVPYPVITESISQFYSLYMPRTMVVNEYNKWAEVYEGGVDPNMYCIRHSYNLMKEYSDNNKITYDYVIIIRPDTLFDKTKTLKEDIDQVDDERTFCYARLYDKTNENLDHIESIYWLAKPFTMNLVSKFQFIIENRHYSHNINGYVHFGNWIKHGLGLNLKRLKNSKTAVYRWKHYEHGLHPVDVWENFL
jgi:hypothetical protein